MLSNLKSTIATATIGLAKSTTKRVASFLPSEGKTLLIASAAFAAGIATSVGGYYLYKNVIQPRVLSPGLKTELKTEPDLYHPEYVLPSNAEWWRVVEEEEKRNPEFGKDVIIARPYRIDSESDLSTSGGDDDDDFVDADDVLYGGKGVEVC